MGACCSMFDISTEDEVAIRSDFPTDLGLYSFPEKPQTSAVNVYDPTDTTELQFYRSLIAGIDVMVVPMARTGIICKLRYEPKLRKFILRRDHLNRVIDLSNIQRILHTPEELSRVETQMSLTDDQNCCALLLKANSCMTFRFLTKKENKEFIEVVKGLIAFYKDEIPRCATKVGVSEK